jgi:hypothetical protein
MARGRDRSATSVGSDALSSWSSMVPMDPRDRVGMYNWSRVDSKLTMSIVHGGGFHCQRHTLRTVTAAWVAGGANLQISIFFGSTLPTIVRSFEDSSFPVPHTLLMQCDRGSDVWCKTWLGVFSALMEQHAEDGKFFQRTTCTALPVGHTHSDYDTAGSHTLRELLGRRGKPGQGLLSPADTEPRLQAMDESSCASVDDAWDFRSWVAGHVHTKVQNHCKALQWDLRLENGEAIWYHSNRAYEGAGSELKETGRFGRLLQSTPSRNGPTVAGTPSFTFAEDPRFEQWG